VLAIFVLFYSSWVVAVVRKPGYDINKRDDRQSGSLFGGQNLRLQDERQQVRNFFPHAAAAAVPQQKCLSASFPLQPEQVGR
jgi:hypothetical protein